MLTLNQISEASSRDNASYARETLQTLVAGPRHANFNEIAGRLSLELGLYLYALEADEAEIRSCFTTAAQYLSLALAGRKQDSDADRSPYEAEQFVNVIVCFGNEADCRGIAALQPRQYRNPQHKQHEALAQYLATLLPQLGGGEPSAPALRAVLARCEARTASKEDRLFLAPSVRGLLAVVEEDESAWNLALAQLTAAHAEEARTGDFRLLPDGFVCFRALMLAKLGMDADLYCRAASEYLPVLLLADEPSA
jgi:hypothetical protein